MAAIPRCDKPSLEHFREEYALPGCPVILTGLTDEWAARRWTPDGPAMHRQLSEIAERKLN